MCTYIYIYIYIHVECLFAQRGSGRRRPPPKVTGFEHYSVLFTVLINGLSLHVNVLFLLFVNLGRS